ncbi:MAG: oligopeptide/dipeptide ABC transporter ATP-binding protein [Candidatus Puniceispirillaceae bacterium]
MVEPVVKLEALTKSFAQPRRSLLAQRQRLHAVKDVSLDITRGEAFGIIGESGCGKSTLARMIVGLHDPDSGGIQLGGRDTKAMSTQERNRIIQYVFQDPAGSLNPRKTVRQILMTPLRALRGLDCRAAETELAGILNAVKLPTEALSRFPHEFSGGQAQRISIARALLARPEIIVLDEPVSALDVSIQAQILALLADLRAEFDLTYIFISHDLAVVETFCDRVAVMYFGEVVEVAAANSIFTRARHPYTNLLARTVPRRGDDLFAETQGELPDPLNPPQGCAFRARCPNSGDICMNLSPALHKGKAGAHVACHFADEG